MKKKVAKNSYNDNAKISILMTKGDVCKKKNEIIVAAESKEGWTTKCCRAHGSEGLTCMQVQEYPLKTGRDEKEV